MPQIHANLTVSSKSGKVTMTDSNGTPITDSSLGQGVTITTAPGSSVTLTLGDGSVVVVEGGTTVTIDSVGNGKAEVHLTKGSLAINNSTGNAAINVKTQAGGTEFSGAVANVSVKNRSNGKSETAVSNVSGKVTTDFGGEIASGAKVFAMTTNGNANVTVTKVKLSSTESSKIATTVNVINQISQQINLAVTTPASKVERTIISETTTL